MVEVTEHCFCHRNRVLSNMLNLLDLAPADAERTLREFAAAHGEKPFRGSQVIPHLWQKPVASFEQMTDLPKAFRDLLAQHFTLPRLELLT